MLISTAFLLLITTYTVNSAKILGIFPHSGYSQYILGSALMKTLAERGHEVTVISPFELKKPIRNYKDVKTELKRESRTSDLYNLESLDIFSNIADLYEMGLSITEATLKSEVVQKLLKSNAKFDLVISETFVNEAHVGFAYHYKAPLVYFSSLYACEWTNSKVANPSPFSTVPVLFSGYNDQMSFWQRFRNTAAGIFDRFYQNFIVYPRQNEILQRYFPGAPHISELVYNSSLVLLNSHPAMNSPVAHVPSMIEVGGFHVEPKELPKDLQEFLDGAKDGAIFFSMGSNLKSAELSKEKLDGILKTFRKLKQKVLWKWEDEDLPGRPENVKVGKWLPQQDVLAHPNVRIFISHGGLLSTTESVHSGVPIIGIPIYGDQKMNIETAVLYGYGLQVPYQELSEQTLNWAINEMLTNSSYTETARRRSRILKDQPMSPKDAAVFWIEYVLRHRGATHLRSAALRLSWYQYFLLDILAVVLAALWVVFKLLKFVASKVFGTRTKTIKRKQQ